MYNMARGIVRRNNLTKDTILKIAAAGILMLGGGSPFTVRSIQTYFKDRDKRLARRRARIIWELQKRKVISITELEDGRIKIELAQRGKKIIQIYKLEDVKLKRPKVWDKRWRIVMYDIPSKRRSASQAFRKKLEDLGLYRLQKSVWISPYDCLSELDFLASIFEIEMDKHVHYFVSAEIPKRREIEKFFEL